MHVGELENLSVRIPASQMRKIEQLVRMGRYTSISELVRAAIRELLDKELREVN